MTTIVADRNGMASDRRVSGGPMFRAIKIRRIGDSLYGACGNLSQALKMFEWFENPDMRPEWKTESGFTILQLSPRGLFLWEMEMIAIPVDRPFYAIGSGAEYAIGALEAGADLRTAIKIASKYDTATGSEVQEHLLTVAKKAKP